ncbi:MAG: hypothetical protein M1324_00475 [Patescibacteria group bacterium]|nr:hypothetical protein [Patescibacteria group bacterium]
MNRVAAFFFRNDLTRLHKDVNKIRKQLRLAKRNPASVDGDALWEMIVSAEKDVLRIEKDMKKQIAIEKGLEWYHSLKFET